jgi:hypothetical protein
MPTDANGCRARPTLEQEPRRSGAMGSGGVALQGLPLHDSRARRRNALAQ